MSDYQKAKLDAYSKSNIDEYWIVNTKRKIIDVYKKIPCTGNKGKMLDKTYTSNDIIPFSLFAEEDYSYHFIDLSKVFPKEPSFKKECIMEQPAKKYYTFADILSLGEDVRAEIIYGDLYMMSPPLRIHQQILSELHRQIANYLIDKPCQVFPAPFGVRLFEEANDTPDDVDTLVDPDIFVICDKSKLDEYGCKGAPDFIAEILSPSARRRNKVTKLKLYEKAKVREYWIVDPVSQSVDVFLLDENGKFTPSEAYSKTDPAKITVLNDCPIDLNTIFAEKE